MISSNFVSRHNWIQFRNGKVLQFDSATSLLAVDIKGKHYGIYITPETEICRDDRVSSVKEIKVGDRVGGYTKVINGRSVGMELGFGNFGRAIPYGIPLSWAVGFIKSPYAADKPAIKIDPGTPTGTLIKCPYTGKTFQMPFIPMNWKHHYTPD